MKVFKFSVGDYYYAYAAKTEEEAREAFNEEYGDTIENVEEIPEADWDKKEIAMYEDNDTEKEPFYLSIREIIVGEDPQLIFSNAVL